MVPDESDESVATGTVLRRLRSHPSGLSTAEAERRLVRYGPNSLTKRSTLNWPGELAAQFTHPLALLLVLAAGLAFVSGTPVLGWTISAVVLVNAAFAFA
jgi:magnesium-transporting ATPase (P-type)